MNESVTASLMGIINDGEYYFDENFPVRVLF
jgi:hypothetical protein